MTYKEYKDLETGEVMLTLKQALQLKKLFKVKAHYFLDAARQLDTVLTQRQVINILKSDNARLNELMTEGYEFIHQSKQLAAEQHS